MLRSLNMREFVLLFVVVCVCSHWTSAGGRPAGKPVGKSSLAVITNWGGDSVSIVNTSTGKELSKIAVGPKPYDIICDPRGSIAYTTCSGANFIAKIDLVANLEMKDQRIIVGSSPRDISLTSDGKKAVVACAGSDYIAVVDLIANKVLYTVAVGQIPYGVGLANDDHTAIITLWGSNKAVLVNLGDDSGQVVKSFDVGSLPYTAWISNKGNLALVTCFGSGKVYIIDLKNSKVLDPVQVGRSPWGMALSPDGATAAIMNFYSGDVSLLSITDVALDPLAASTPPVRETSRVKLTVNDPLAAAAPAAAGGSAKNVAFNPDGSEILMSDLADNRVMLLDMSTRSIGKAIPVGQAPYGIAFVPRSE